MRILSTAALALTVITAAPLAAQPARDARVSIPDEGRGTLTFYERTNFRGQATTFRSGDPTVTLPFFPRSIRAEGTWRLCPDTEFRGRCLFANSDYETERELGLNFNVRSLRPTGGGNDGGGSLPGPGEVAGGPSLRGSASQYFPEPQYGRQRVLACPTGTGNYNCAQQTANRFCQTAKWRSAQYFQLQGEGRRSYLSDILCTNRSG